MFRLGMRKTGLATVAVLTWAAVTWGFAWAPAAAAHSCTGRVGHIIDADTIYMKCDGQRTKVRLAGIDAPETPHPHYGKSGQPYGEAATQALRNRIGGQTIKMTWSSKGTHGRILGTLYHGGTNINLWLVKDGDAWDYKHYNHDPKYAEAEQAARSSHRGLWSQPNPEAPWHFRHRH